jgi:hypothetical protein
MGSKYPVLTRRFFSTIIVKAAPLYNQITQMPNGYQQRAFLCFQGPWNSLERPKSKRNPPIWMLNLLCYKIIQVSIAVNNFHCVPKLSLKKH